MNFSKYIFILLDGIPYHILDYLIKNDALPNIKKYIIQKGCFKKATSVFPSTTGPAYFPFFTGQYPGTINMPGIRWFSKKNYKKFDFKSPGLCSYMGIDGFNFTKALNIKDSIFNKFEKSYNIYNHIKPLLNKRYDLTKNSKLLDYFYAYFFHKWSFIDTKAFKYTLKVLDNNFDFISVLVPGIDEYAHLYGVDSNIVLNEYINIDKHIGILCEKLIAKNLFDKTLLIISSDHGLTNTHTHIDFEKRIDALAYKTLSFPNVFRPKVKSATMVSGNSMLNFYIKKDIKSWGQRLFYEELEQKGIIGKIFSIDGIDIVAAESIDGSIVVISKHNIAKIRHKESLISYEFQGELDPLEYNKKFNNLTYREALIKTYNTKYPDALMQLIQIFKSERAGDLIVTAKEGFDLRARFEINQHFASHGSLLDKHINVPFISNYNFKTDFIRTVDIYPSALALLGFDTSYLELDGVNLLEERV